MATVLHLHVLRLFICFGSKICSQIASHIPQDRICRFVHGPLTKSAGFGEEEGTAACPWCASPVSLPTESTLGFSLRFSFALTSGFVKRIPREASGRPIRGPLTCFLPSTPPLLTLQQTLSPCTWTYDNQPLLFTEDLLGSASYNRKPQNSSYLNNKPVAVAPFLL